jgi:hypothetical protein
VFSTNQPYSLTVRNATKCQAHPGTPISNIDHNPNNVRCSHPHLRCCGSCPPNRHVAIRDGVEDKRAGVQPATCRARRNSLRAGAREQTARGWTRGEWLRPLSQTLCGAPTMNQASVSCVMQCAQPPSDSRS